MNRNVGGYDRIARLVGGPVLVAIGVALAAGYLNVGPSGTVGLAVTALVIVAGAVFLVTGTTRKCPIHAATGMDTYDRD